MPLCARILKSSRVEAEVTGFTTTTLGSLFQLVLPWANPVHLTLPSTLHSVRMDLAKWCRKHAFPTSPLFLLLSALPTSASTKAIAVHPQKHLCRLGVHLQMYLATIHLLTTQVYPAPPFPLVSPRAKAVSALLRKAQPN